MKKICMFILLTFLCSTQAGATIYYVDSTYGNDGWSGSESTPLKTIKEALNRVSSNDTIKLMDGDFIEAKFTTNDNGINWDVNRVVQINIDTNNITMDKDSGNPTIVGNDYGGSDMHYVVRIDQPSVKIKNINFDGLYFDQNVGYQNVECLGCIAITPDADYTEISYCDFTEFGHSPSPSIGVFMSCVGGGDHRSDTNILVDAVVSYNTFHDNRFSGQYAHEVYFTNSSGIDITYNHIINDGDGIPLKLRDGCQNTLIEGNTVIGTRDYFLWDRPETSTEDLSSGSTVRNNTFKDSLNIIDEELYFKPFNNVMHIATYENNSFYEFSGNDNRYIQGLTFNDSLFVVQKNGHNAEVFNLGRPHVPNPENGYGVANGDYFGQGDICHTNTAGTPEHIVFCVQHSDGNQKVFVDNIDGAFNNGGQPIFDTTRIDDQDYRVTAMTSIDDTTYLTALRNTNTGDVFIYESIISTVKNIGAGAEERLSWNSTYADSITAMAYDGSYVYFATYQNGTSKIYKSTISSLDSNTTPEITQTYYIPAMCYSRGKLVWALYNSGSSSTTLYNASVSNISSPTSSTLRLGGKFIVSLAGSRGTGNKDFLYTVVYDAGGTDYNNNRKIYFTNNLAVWDQALYFYSQWYQFF